MSLRLACWQNGAERDAAIIEMSALPAAVHRRYGLGEFGRLRIVTVPPRAGLLDGPR